jgi:hypothetical protein
MRMHRENEIACLRPPLPRGVKKHNGETPMPIVSARVNLHKRHTAEELEARRDAAALALCRIYCDVIGFWRGCAKKRCKRHRRCCGDAWPCLQRGRAGVPHGLHRKIIAAVRAGGPRRLAPINNLESQMRRNPPRWL